MARNGSGTYSVPNTFVSGNTITASGHNQNWNDIAAEITNSVAADGQTPLTGPLKSANGSAAAPSVTFNSDQDTGFYRKAANSIAMTLEGVDRVVFTTASATFSCALTVSNEFIASATATFILTANFSTKPVVPAKSFAISKIADGTANRLYGTDGSGVATEVTLGNGLALSSSSLSSTVIPVPASFKNLSIKVASTTTVIVAADFVVTTNGTLYQTTALSGTIDLGTNGAANALDAGSIAIDTWYAIWAIAKADGTTAALASTSFTAPTLPTGYTFKARIGAVQTIHATATLYGTWQLGRRAQYVPGLGSTTVPPIIANGTVGTASQTSPTLVSETVAGNGFFVPTTASKIYWLLTNSWKSGTVPANLNLAPSAAYSSSNNGPFGSAGLISIFINNTGGGQSQMGEFLLESSAIYFASGNTGGAVACLGWEDNI